VFEGLTQKRQLTRTVQHTYEDANQ
jgi:hypothetical protein